MATRRGVVGVIVEQGRLLVIRRAQAVVAPGKLCFPGGAIELGEGEPQALLRELREELGIAARPVRRLWQSSTAGGVRLAWWLAERDGQPCIPNPQEVASVYWFTAEELARQEDLLESNRQFLAAVASGHVALSADVHDVDDVDGGWPAPCD